MLVPGKILKRLLEEFNNFLKSKTAVEKETGTSQEIRDIIRELTDTLTKISEAGYRAVVVIDALNKVDESGQTTKVKNLILHTKTVFTRPYSWITLMRIILELNWGCKIIYSQRGGGERCVACRRTVAKETRLYTEVCHLINHFSQRSKPCCNK